MRTITHLAVWGLLSALVLHGAERRLLTQRPELKPGTWCLYQESGHMISWSRVVIFTNGSVSVWVDKSENVPLPEQPDFQDKLTPEEKRYLGMWLEVSDIMNVREGLGNSKDSIFELLVIQNGRTNLVEQWAKQPELSPIWNFFYYPKEDLNVFRGRMQRLLNSDIPGISWLG